MVGKHSTSLQERWKGLNVCRFQGSEQSMPKGDFPLPHIDVIVDSATSSAMYSFMGKFSGYNQIIMAVMDKIKIVFITEWETYCYKVMLFRLKNAGATY